MNQKIVALVSKIKKYFNIEERNNKRHLISMLKDEGYTHVQDDTTYDSPAIPVDQWIREQLITF